MEPSDKRVVVTDRRFPDSDPYSAIVEEVGAELVYADLETESDVIEATRDADVIVSFKAPINCSVIENVGSADLILRNGTGYDNVDVKAATDQGIPVSCIPDYCTEEVASHAITLMLSTAHDVVYLDRKLRRSNGWGERKAINPLQNGVFGAIGLGRIGRTAAQMASGFGMDVIAYDPYVPDDVFDAFDVERVSFDELIDQADCVSVHAPLTGETHHMLSSDEFDQMKEFAVVVNTARGPIIDEEALVDAIESGTVWGAGLDVFETEPPNETPAFESDRIICSPHHAGISERSTEQCIEIGCEKIHSALTGDHLGNIVNPEVYDTDAILSPERGSWN